MKDLKYKNYAQHEKPYYLRKLNALNIKNEKQFIRAYENFELKLINIILDLKFNSINTILDEDETAIKYKRKRKFY